MLPELRKERDAAIHKYCEETACSINEHVTEFDFMQCLLKWEEKTGSKVDVLICFLRMIKILD